MKATTSKRATVYFDPTLFRAIQIKAVETETSVSAIVSEALKQYLSEDAEDLAAFDERATEPGVSFEDVVKRLKREGKI
jgi:hypothetical protein